MNSKKAGLHLDNRRPIDDQTKEYLLRMQPTCLTVTENLNLEDLQWLYANFSDATIIIRGVYQQWDNMEGYFACTLTLWRMVRLYYPNEQVIVQLFNEPQFLYEGFGQSEEDIERFYQTWLWGHDWLKGQEGVYEILRPGSDIRFGFTPMAPGNQDLPIIEEPGRRTYLEYCQPLLAMCEYMLLHVYAEYPEQVEDEWIGGRMVQYKKWSQGKPIYITESAIGTKDQASRGADTVRWFKKWIQDDSQILGVTQWLGNVPGDPGQDSDFDVNRHFENSGEPRTVYHEMLGYIWAPVETPPEPPAEPEQPPQPDPLSLAVDVSNYTGELSASTIDEWRSAGVSRVIVRASTEDSAKVAIARQQMQAVIDAGFELHVYPWLYFDDVMTAEQQMQAVLQTYDDLPIGYWWPDCEGENPFNPIETVNAIGQALNALGDRPKGIYTAAWWWIPKTGNSTAFADLPLWNANYDGVATLDGSVPWLEDSKPEGFASYGGWTSQTMKQYAADVMLGGVKVDLNVYASQAAPPAEETVPDEIPDEYRQWGDTWEEIAYYCRGQWVAIDGVAGAALRELRSLKADILTRANQTPDY